MTLLGAEGLQSIAAASHDNARSLKERLTAIDGISSMFEGPFFHEFVLKLNKPIELVLEQLNDMGIQGGYSLKSDYPELGDCLLVCATETKTGHDLERYQQLLAKVMS
jgi:glycine dehydrogenase subunit 1